MHDRTPTYQELKYATQEIGKHVQNSKSNRYIAMDLFYAVECGLKALLLSANSNFQDSYKTHDINELAQLCNFPLKINTIIYINEQIKTIHLKHLHTILRYGIKMKKDELEKFKNDIMSVHIDILNELARR